MNIVKVKGVGERSVVCDLITVTLEVAVDNKNSGFAVKMVDDRVELLLKYLKDNGISTEKIKMKKSKVSKMYSSDEYTARKEIEFKAALSMIFNNFIYKIPQQFEFGVEVNIVYGLEDKQKIVNQVMQEAFEDSRQKAALLAETCGKTIVGFEYINYGNVSSYSDIDDTDIVRCGPERSLAKSICVESDRLRPDTVLVSENVGVAWLVE